MSDEEYEEQEEATPVQVVHYRPTARFSPWDLPGIAAAWLGGLFSVTGNALSILANRFEAAANFDRDRRDTRDEWAFFENQQRKLADELRNQVGVEVDWAPREEQ